jgi:hypothetical protein
MPQVDIDSLLEQPLGVIYSNNSHRGAALLITHSCVIDKPKTTRLQFIPVRDLMSSGLDDNQIRDIRRNVTNPADAVYLKLGEDQEGFALLSESFVIPRDFFQAERIDCSWHDEVSMDDPMRVCAKTNDSRALTMGPDELELLMDKINFFYTRRKRPPEPS